MSDLSDSVAEVIKKRTASTVYGTYLFFWAAFHWQGIYTTVFTSQEFIFTKYNMLKNEYVSQYFFGWHGRPTIVGYLVPLIFTALFIWPLPKMLLIHIYRHEQRHKVDKRRVKIEEEQKLEVEKKALAVQEEKTIKAKIKTAKVKKAAVAKDPSILWDDEYKDFVSKEHEQMFKEILTSIYERNGDIGVDDSFGREIDRLHPRAIKMADVRGLIEINNKDSKISLTEKGKYFARKFDGF
ncbi:MAG: hypothetical protein Q7T41_01240 [Candidatus Saccharibacteria bacterium]|nr:hypothetical protein [Candidatus Saccharibacteria bacterium]